MDFSGLKRDPGKVRAVLVEQPDRSVVAARECKIYIPSRFLDKQLAEIAAETYILGIFATVVDGKYYAVTNLNAMVRITPTSIATVKIGDDSYYEFTFEAGSTVIADTLLIKNDSLVYKIYDEFISKGKVPVYLNYEDMAKLFYSSQSHAGVGFGSSHAILEMFTAAIARDPSNRMRYFRHVYEGPQGSGPKEPVFVPFSSITFGATNTTAKLNGSYFEEGVISAVVNPAESVERIEELLRR